jgi:hypothetical protein
MTDRRIFLWIASIMTAICLALLGMVIYAAATARADSSCTSSRNGWVYDRCTGVTTPGPDAWTKPGIGRTLRRHVVATRREGRPADPRGTRDRRCHDPIPGRPRRPGRAVVRAAVGRHQGRDVARRRASAVDVSHAITDKHHPH